MGPTRIISDSVRPKKSMCQISSWDLQAKREIERETYGRTSLEQFSKNYSELLSLFQVLVLVACIRINLIYPCTNSDAAHKLPPIAHYVLIFFVISLAIDFVSELLLKCMPIFTSIAGLHFMVLPGKESYFACRKIKYFACRLISLRPWFS